MFLVINHKTTGIQQEMSHLWSTKENTALLSNVGGRPKFPLVWDRVCDSHFAVWSDWYHTRNRVSSWTLGLWLWNLAGRPDQASFSYVSKCLRLLNCLSPNFRNLLDSSLPPKSHPSASPGIFLASKYARYAKPHMFLHLHCYHPSPCIISGSISSTDG